MKLKKKVRSFDEAVGIVEAIMENFRVERFSIEFLKGNYCVTVKYTEKKKN